MASPAAQAEKLGEEGRQPSGVSKKEQQKLADEKRNKQGNRLRKQVLISDGREMEVAWGDEKRAGVTVAGATLAAGKAGGRTCAAVLTANTHTRAVFQGAKANKFDAEAAGKKKNTKNGLMH